MWGLEWCYRKSLGTQRVLNMLYVKVLQNIKSLKKNCITRKFIYLMLKRYAITTQKNDFCDEFPSHFRHFWADFLFKSDFKFCIEVYIAVSKKIK